LTRKTGRLKFTQRYVVIFLMFVKPSSFSFLELLPCVYWRIWNFALFLNHTHKFRVVQSPLSGTVIVSALFSVVGNITELRVLQKKTTPNAYTHMLTHSQKHARVCIIACVTLEQAVDDSRQWVFFFFFFFW
jgi:hypothetical protein